jgi:hypothetical protein
LTWFDPRTNSLENNNYYNDNSYIECDVEYAPDEPHGKYNFPNEFESYKDPYYFEGRLISPSFSIAIGVAELSYKTNKDAKPTMSNGLEEYNGGGDPNYLEHVTEKLKDLGYSSQDIAKLLS